jgi:hypoxanthine phosphoribosyltransferase
MNDIQLHDLRFEPFLSARDIRSAVETLAGQLDKEYGDKNPVLLVVLNGAFVFAADLIRKMSIPLRIDFVKITSYDGTGHSGKTAEHFLWQIPLKDQHVIIIEDIVDTGHTLSHLKKRISSEHPASIAVACLLFKPQAYRYDEKIDYQGRKIPNDFVVGYGLDYNGLGRDLDGIYRKKD